APGSWSWMSPGVRVCVVEYTPTMLVMALDVGTSSARAAWFDASGQAIPEAEGRVGYAARVAPDGEVVLDPDALVDAVASAIDQALAGAGPRAREIAGVGASVFWHSLLALDDARHPLLPVLTWADTRSAEAAAELRARLDGTAVHARTGALLPASYYPARLRWLPARGLGARYLVPGEACVAPQAPVAGDYPLVAEGAAHASRLPPVDGAPAP